MEQQPNKAESIIAPLKKVTPLSKYFAMALFISLPFIGGFVGYSHQKAPILIQQQVAPVVETKTRDLYKKSFYGGEIPISWSQYTNYEAAPLENTMFLTRSAKFSFADDNVTVSDWNASQVDFYLLTEEAANAFIRDVTNLAATDTEIEIKEEQVGGVSAMTVRWPLDDGMVTKAGTGGTDYLIKLDYQDYGQYLFISKQAQGDEEFENTFSNYLDTADFTKPHTP